MTYNPRPADLSARDLFAMAALVGILVGAELYQQEGDDTVVAELAYRLADAMLKARKQQSDD